jgi:hypothetical protein
MRANLLFLLIVLINYSGVSQEIKGTVIDAKTKAPIETATVYFDNTTKGVITNKKGEFSIKYSDAIQSPLIISFLGYEKKIITNYREKNTLIILLEEKHESLTEVIINANDGMTRKQKLRHFKREFLGTSKFGKSCEILNEDDIILIYNKKNRTLTANSITPIKVKNKALQYLLTYDINNFVITFNSSQNNIFSIKSVSFYGNTYYEDLKDINQQKATKNRNKAYLGSRLQFMRSLYSQTFLENEYQLFYKRNKVNPWEYFYVQSQLNSKVKKVALTRPLNILFNNSEQSSIKFSTPWVYLDFYGNYTNVKEVMFSGAMGNQRIGELLPFDYGLNLKPTNSKLN